MYSPNDLASCSIGELATGVCSLPLPLELCVSLELSDSSELSSPWSRFSFDSVGSW